MQTYAKNKKFKIQKNENKIYFIHKNGQQVRTDELGALIWKNCDQSNFDQVKKSIGERLNCPHNLLEHYLYLLTIAGIIKKENKRVKNCIEEKKAATVVPKMLLYSLPTCINSIGNYIPPKKWGSDNFMGHFDFGQFDNPAEVPSACFGAVMLKRKALEDIGPIDNRYQAYYEDADWSYRARLKGWKIVPAPRATIYHKFETSFKDFPGLKSKLVVRNRLRFAMKIFSFYYLKGFLKNYLREDIRNFMHFFKTFNLKMLKIYLFSYFSLLFQLPELLFLRVKIQKSRNENISDKDILNLAPHYPPLLDEISAPILSIESIRNIYFRELNKK